MGHQCRGGNGLSLNLNHLVRIATLKQFTPECKNGISCHQVIITAVGRT
jgi:hypothetical protein